MKQYIEIFPHLNDDIKHICSQEHILNLDVMLREKQWRWNDYLWWFDVENILSQEEYDKLKIITQRFQAFEKVVVVWIWGSYLWSKAVIHALHSIFDEQKIIFAWFQIDGNYMKELLKLLHDKDYGVIVISKSWTTLEPALAFRMLLQNLQSRYSESEISTRIVAITDKEKWVLKQLASKYDFDTFVIPDDVWGRYSIFTPVGLFPIAVAGYDIDALLSWARDMKQYLDIQPEIEKNPAYTYAILRNTFLQDGKNIEILVNFDMRLSYISEWWKQLFWESEGKEWKWIFPTNLNFSTDLHSMGQLVQEWTRNIFETFLIVQNDTVDLTISKSDEDTDGLNFLSGKSFHMINQSAIEWTLQAHREWWVPCIEIYIPEVNEYYIGQLLYFFQRSCALSANLLGVNPFNQPWVEAYKKYMNQKLK